MAAQAAWPFSVVAPVERAPFEREAAWRRGEVWGFWVDTVSWLRFEFRMEVKDLVLEVLWMLLILREKKFVLRL